MTAHSHSGILIAVFGWILRVTFLGQISSVSTSEYPVLSIKPVPQDDGTLDSLIWFRSTSPRDFSNLTTSLDTFLDGYRRPGSVPGRHSVIVSCDYDQLPGPGKVCDVDIRNWYPCIPDNYYNYHRASPCIFLTIDTPLGWVPEFHNDTSALPAGMPSDLKSYIINLADVNPLKLNTVWVSCEGVYPADVEFIGPLKYIPGRGFPGYHFANNNVEGYLKPVLALHFERPSSGILMNIKCKAWARNIDNTGDSPSQNGQFSLLID